MLTQHSKNQNLEEWNCNDCAFQGNCATELMNHLKITTHQPSKNVKDKRKVFQDYKQCFTCKMDFDGFFNLMNHRKSVHPSNKQCRNYATGRCTRGSDCWYVHSEKSENEDIFENFKCDLCAEQFKGRGDFMRHKNFRSRQWGSSLTFCARWTVGSSPHQHERKFSGARVCRVTFKHLPQPLRSHI